MKLLKRKTRKAIDKSVRKMLKKHGAAVMAGLASSLVASIATLAETEAADRLGRSNLMDVLDRAKRSLADDSKGKHGRKSKKGDRHGKAGHGHRDKGRHGRQARPDALGPASDTEGTQLSTDEMRSPLA